MTSCGRFLTATLPALACLISLPAVAEDAPEDEITIERIVTSIQANYDRIHDARFRVEETLRTPGLRERTEHLVFLEGQGPQQGFGITVREPIVKRTADMYLRGDSPIRRDSPMAPMDLRQAGVKDAGRTLIDQLRSSTILDVQKVEGEQNRTFYDVLLEQKGGDPGRKLTYRCRFDASRSFLPVHVAYLSPEHSEWLTIDIGYRAVLPQTWFVAHVIRTYTRSGQVCEQHVVGDVVVNKGLEEIEPTRR